MTPAQQKLYWREWLAAKRAANLDDSDRYTIMEEALASPSCSLLPAPCSQLKSSKDLTNEDLDKVLASFRAISHPASVNSQLRQAGQDQTRLLHSIQTQLQLLAALGIDHPHQYAKKIITDKHATDLLDALDRSSSGQYSISNFQYSIPSLTAIRITLHRCVSRKRAAAGITEHDLHQLARVPCERKTCAQCRAQNVAASLQGAPINLNREVALS